jgi:hypothetical protein
MTCEMELNQRGLQIPSEILAALALADITLEAHMCRHLIMLMLQTMTVEELIDVLEGMQEAFDQLLNGLIAACRPACCHCCQTAGEGNYDLSQVPERLLAVLMDNDCCKGLLARRLETGEAVYGE